MAAISSTPATFVLGVRRGLSNRIEAPTHQHFARLSPSRPAGRLANATGLQLKKLVAIKLSASCSNAPNNSDTSKESTSSRSSSRSDPPLLTILAGLVVLFLVLWVLSSLFMWLVGLVLLPPSR